MFLLATPWALASLVRWVGLQRGARPRVLAGEGGTLAQSYGHFRLGARAGRYLKNMQCFLQVAAQQIWVMAHTQLYPSKVCTFAACCPSLARLHIQLCRISFVRRLQELWRGKVEQISWSPRAFVYHNFLSDEECEHLKALAKKRLTKSTVRRAPGGGTRQRCGSRASLSAQHSGTGKTASCFAPVPC